MSTIFLYCMTSSGIHSSPQFYWSSVITGAIACSILCFVWDKHYIWTETYEHKFCIQGGLASFHYSSLLVSCYNRSNTISTACRKECFNTVPCWRYWKFLILWYISRMALLCFALLTCDSTWIQKFRIVGLGTEAGMCGQQNHQNPLLHIFCGTT